MKNGTITPVQNTSFSIKTYQKYLNASKYAQQSNQCQTYAERKQHLPRNNQTHAKRTHVAQNAESNKNPSKTLRGAKQSHAQNEPSRQWSLKPLRSSSKTSRGAIKSTRHESCLNKEINHCKTKHDVAKTMTRSQKKPRKNVSCPIFQRCVSLPCRAHAASPWPRAQTKHTDFPSRVAVEGRKTPPYLRPLQTTPQKHAAPLVFWENVIN